MGCLWSSSKSASPSTPASSDAKSHSLPNFPLGPTPAGTCARLQARGGSLSRERIRLPYLADTSDARDRFELLGCEVFNDVCGMCLATLPETAIVEGHHTVTRNQTPVIIFNIKVPGGIVTYEYSKPSPPMGFAAQWKTLMIESTYEAAKAHATYAVEEPHVHFSNDQVPTTALKSWEAAEFFSDHVNGPSPTSVVIPWISAVIRKSAIESSGGGVHTIVEGVDRHVSVTVPKGTLISGLSDKRIDPRDVIRCRTFILTMKYCRLKWSYDQDKDEVMVCVSEARDYDPSGVMGDPLA